MVAITYEKKSGGELQQVDQQARCAALGDARKGVERCEGGNGEAGGLGFAKAPKREKAARSSCAADFPRRREEFSGAERKYSREMVHDCEPPVAEVGDCNDWGVSELSLDDLISFG
jgi:hypothetical protein